MYSNESILGKREFIAQRRATNDEGSGANDDPLQDYLRVKTRSHTPWPSLMPRFSNLVSGR